MKQGVKFFLFVMAFGLMLLVRQPVKAQCAQCAATVESSTQSGSKKANGLNDGILFLLGAPYFAVGIIGFIWYKKYRRKDVNLSVRKEKLHLN